MPVTKNDYLPAFDEDDLEVKAIVLVVEDQAIIRINAMEMVIGAGFEALGAKNADEAIEILEARSDIRLVFTDVEIPGTMDGIKLAHFIRGRWPKIHMIVASGKVIIQENALPHGSAFFSKPYFDGSIVAEMTRMLGMIDGPALNYATPND